MKTIDNPTIIATDVDGTLLKLIIGEEDRELYNEEDIVAIERNGVRQEFVINRKIVEHMRLHKLQGHYTVCWSGAGAAWCEKVVKLLKLEDCIDLCLGKIKYSYDDSMASNWLVTVHYPFPTKMNQLNPVI